MARSTSAKFHESYLLLPPYHANAWLYYRNQKPALAGSGLKLAGVPRAASKRSSVPKKSRKTVSGSVHVPSSSGASSLGPGCP